MKKDEVVIYWAEEDWKEEAEVGVVISAVLNTLSFRPLLEIQDLPIYINIPYIFIMNQLVVFSNLIIRCILLKLHQVNVTKNIKAKRVSFF